MTSIEPRPLVGIIANPVSARDIRRVIANATSLQITDRANIVLRVLASLRACGVERVVMMPENGGIRGHVHRGLQRAANRGEATFPGLEYLDMPVTGTVGDTRRAARMMRDVGVRALIVLGGDGTHRAVVAACRELPIAGISTGTNNAFPEHREPTVTGLAVGLAVTGRIPPAVAFAPNKLLEVEVGGSHHDVALVDVAIVAERYVGARALWRTESFRELFVTFADPEVIGMSAIAGLLAPRGAREPGGVHVALAPLERAPLCIHAPIAPGMIRAVGVEHYAEMPADRPFGLSTPAGSIALDGEREIAFDDGREVSITLRENAFRTVDVSACMRHAARHGSLVGADALRGSTDSITKEEE
ncbi:MAG: NAD(+)/NADH kinase [Ectothiorhodospiraceae bacterium]|nr:NAD(+)/NADH kinase [Ectothiorhodospiraceae bacterium]